MSVTPEKPIRLTISVSPAVHAVFSRMAVASGNSLSKTMGDWLEDTSEAAEFMTTKIEQARTAPKRVIQELRAFSLGFADECQDALSSIRAGHKEPRKDSAEPGRPGRLAAGAIPPSCNTGGKGSKQRSRNGGKGS